MFEYIYYKEDRLYKKIYLKKLFYFYIKRGYIFCYLKIFITFGSEVEELLIDRPRKPNTSDIYMSIARLALCVNILTGIIICTIANQANVWYIFFETKNLYNSIKSKNKKLDISKNNNIKLP